MSTRPAIALALACTPVPAIAQHVPPADNTRYARAIAAGYKAAMYCSGIFTAGRTPAQIDADELTGIYPEYDAIVPTLTARVDRFASRVTVPFDPAMPPREARWLPGTGCQTQPIGWTALALEDVAPAPAKRAPADPRPWPMGDGPVRPRSAAVPTSAVTAAFDGRSYGTGKTTGIVILRNGRITAERYAGGWGPFVPNRTWSVGKSISGTLVGLATAAGKADVSKPAALPEWQLPDDPRRRVTLDQLLRMASGLHSGAAGNRINKFQIQ